MDGENRSPRIGKLLYEEWYLKSNKATIAELTFTLAATLISLRENVDMASPEAILAFLQEIELRWPAAENEDESD